MQEGRKEKRRKMGLTKCDIHFSSSITRFAVGDFSRRNGERRVILSALFISAAFNGYDGLSSKHRSFLCISKSSFTEKNEFKSSISCSYATFPFPFLSLSSSLYEKLLGKFSESSIDGIAIGTATST